MSALGALALLLLAILATAAIVLRASQRRRPGRIAQYSPPPGVGILSAAVLTRTEKRAAAAELVNLAVRKNLRFLAPDAGSKQLRVELLDGPPLGAEQRALIAALFGAPRTARTARKRRRVRTIRRDAALNRAVRGVVDGVRAQLTRSGQIRFDAAWPVMLVRVGAVASLALYGIALLWAPDIGLALLLGIAALGLATLALCAPPARLRLFSDESFEVRDHLNGLNDYIALAEADRIRFLQSPNGALTQSIDTPEGRVEALVLNEKLLPYAILFGHEQEWAKLLETEQRELAASGVLDAYDGLHLLAVVGNPAAELSLPELLGGLHGFDVDMSLLAGIELPDIDLGALSLDL
ncbi:DUF2207 family protein [Microterricola viridarii]|uniref:Predicted membrane protein YciQ-like C-terminal domain-containing protein n=1 Tax=Microterricola viridarii TaxID=412690 RepID=A0A120I0Y4_9MICO|nr:DUF2207 domain-containing protein [Microterricola viridarii]AMB58384.1 hypothetical protein AWU67_05430 [Microterricola viridarii]